MTALWTWMMGWARSPLVALVDGLGNGRHWGFNSAETALWPWLMGWATVATGIQQRRDRAMALVDGLGNGPHLTV